MKIVVAGGGMAGLCSALVLARRGHAVTLVERDSFEASADWHDAVHWSRAGIPHFHQPHAFLPRGRALLRALLPDVRDALLAAGAEELDVGGKVPGGTYPESDTLTYLWARRPLLEWALRQAVAREPGVTVSAGAAIVGLVIEGHATEGHANEGYANEGHVAESGTGARASAGRDVSLQPPRVRGVRTANGDVVGDVVIDALGRRSPVGDWLAALGARAPHVSSAETSVLYYSRYFQVHPGQRFPDGPWLFGPRGDLGYAAFSTFGGDNGTYAVVLAPPTWDRALRALRGEAAFMAAARAIPSLAPLLDPAFAVPITPVLPMGGLQNMLRDYAPDGDPVAAGLFPVGDAYCHTNPVFALGLSLALVHAAAVAQAVAPGHGPPDPRAQGLAYLAATRREVTERFELARDTDAARTRLWRGERLDVARRDGCYPLFVLVAGNAVAMRDPDVFRAVVRRSALLDATSALDDDEALLRRIETRYAELLAAGPPPAPGPSRDALLATVATAERSAAASAPRAPA